MSARACALFVLLLLGASSPVAAQTGLTGRTLGIGATPTPPDSGTTVRISGLASSGTGQPLWSESDGDVFRRAIAKGDLPAVTVFTDQANTFGAFLQTFDGDVAVNGGDLTSTSSLSVTTGGRVFGPAAAHVERLGTFARPWLSLHVDELWASTLVSAETMATTGGRWLITTSTTLTEAITSAATTILVEHNSLASGDRVYLEADGRVEYLAITSGATRTNLLAHPSFEASSDWTTNGTGGTFARSLLVPYRGDTSLRIGSQTGTLSMYAASLSYATGTTYTACGYAKKDSGAAVTASELRWWDGNAYADSTVTQEGDWYRFCRTFTTAGTLGDARPTLSYTQGGTVWNLDALQIEATSTTRPWSANRSSYTVTRNLDGSGANDWPAGAAVANTGQTGTGWIDCYALRGMKAATEVGPSCVGNVRTGSTYNAWAPRWAIGQLNGLYGLSTSTFGAAFGDPSDVNTLITASYWKLRDGTTDKFSLDGATGNMSLTGNLTVSGSGSFVGSGITVDSGGISATPGGSSTFDTGKAYKFAYTGGSTTGGVYGYENGNDRILRLQANGTNSTYTQYSGLSAVNSSLSGGLALVDAAAGAAVSGGKVTLSATSTGSGTNTLELSGTSLDVNTLPAVSATKTVRNSVGTGTCTLEFTLGLLTGGSC